MQIIIGNIVALLASFIMVYSGYVKQKKKIIFIQTIQLIMFVLSNIILGGFTGAIINTISCIRNIICYKDKLNKKVKIILILLSTLMSFTFNNLGFIGFFPLISTISFTLFMNTKNVIKLKYLIIFTAFLWLVYDLCINSYTSAFFDFLSIIVNFISIVQIIKRTKHEAYSNAL